MFFPWVLWQDGSSCKVFVEPQVNALITQNMDKVKTTDELQKQKKYDNGVTGVAKFSNGNIAFKGDGTFQATIWPNGTKIKGRWRPAQSE